MGIIDVAEFLTQSKAKPPKEGLKANQEIKAKTSSDMTLSNKTAFENPKEILKKVSIKAKAEAPKENLKVNQAIKAKISSEKCGIGRRKTSVARAILVPGSGSMFVNGW